MQTILTTESIDPFRQWLYEKGRSENTQRVYCSDVRLFFEASGLTSLLVSELPPTVATWINTHRRQWVPKTTRRRMTSLRNFGSWAGVDHLLPGFKLPSQGAAVPHPLPRLAADIEAMLDHCKKDHQRALVALLGYEGLRLHEALELGPRHFNVRDMELSIFGKGGKLRVLPLTENAWPYLAPSLITAQLNGSDQLVDYSDRGARHFITELGVKAGITRPVASHDLRMTFATCAYAEEKNLRIIQGWLGHADLGTTQGYLANDMDAMRAAGEF